MKQNNKQMIMKKYFVIAAVAIAAMACSKVDVDNTPAKKVTFQAANYMTQTKAGEVSVFGDFKEFKSRAFLHAEGVDLNADYTVNGTSYQEFFGDAGETVSPYTTAGAKITDPTTSSTNVGYWAPSHEYYWPKSTHSFVNFVGWYGTDGTHDVDPTIAYAYTSSKWPDTVT